MLWERPVKENTLYHGIIVNVRRDQAQLADGRITLREVVEHPGGVAIFAVDEDERVVMVRQFRYPIGEVLLELPAGKLEPGEDPRECALRELEEETGIVPEEVQYMGCSYSSPGIFAERIHLYFARGLKQGTPKPDDGEFLTVERIPLEELLDMIEHNRLPDAKSMVGILKGALLLQCESRGAKGGLCSDK
ncbi:MAG: ADP-ribose pyrophosphatase [Firmicutes bacterium]|nr:ADP-ribose pyrophosphatase [Bacillota bacterium]